MEKTYSKEEFQALVTELEGELNKMLKSAQADSTQPLVKSEEAPKEEEKKEEEKKEENKEESKADEAKPEEKQEEPKAEEKQEAPKADNQEDESHGYDDEDMEEMHKMYGSMSKGELKAHKESVEKCWMAKCGEMTQMAKSEEANQTEVKTEETKPTSEESTLLKSELDGVKKENEDLKKHIEGLVSAINTFVTKKAPVRKAITDIEFVKKSEEGSEEKPLTKSEIDSILRKKAADPQTSAKDREAINGFYLTNAGVEKVAHLLKQ